ncbi:MAG: DUF2911 domain-containing protein [Gemmatimonadota bacterium]
MITELRSSGAVCLTVALLALINARDSNAQIAKSQRGSVGQRIGATQIGIDYSRPVARGRTLYGGVVKWGEVWNPGADTATSISFSRDARVAGELVRAGTYSVWAIPRPDRWTIILSRATPVYHTPYPKGQDALRFDVTPQTGAHMETLAFYFPYVDGHHARLHLHWGTTLVAIPIDAR